MKICSQFLINSIVSLILMSQVKNLVSLEILIKYGIPKHAKIMQKKTGITFGPDNTLMLESDEPNVYNFPENSLIIDRYDRDDVWPSPGCNKPYRDQQKILN